MSTLSHPPHERGLLPRPHSRKEASDESREEGGQRFEGSRIGRAATRRASIAGAEDGSSDKDFYQNRFAWLPGSSSHSDIQSIYSY